MNMSFNKASSPYFNQTTGETLLLTLWIGSLWAIGFLAVPTLFASLEDRQLAGMLAGKMFTAVSYVGLFCGTMLLASAAKSSTQFKTDKRIWLLILMLLLVIIGEFVLQPQMAELKQLGLLEGSETAQQFDRLHHIASTLYMINSLLGLTLLVFQPRKIS